MGPKAGVDVVTKRKTPSGYPQIGNWLFKD
jgi:hypothetical protein